MNSTYDVVYSEIVSRMKDVGELKNDAHLAKVLEITPQALSNYKKKNTISGDLLVKFSYLYGVSIDWLISGSGQMLKAYSVGDDGKLATIAFVKATPFVQGGGDQGVRVTSISIMSPDELISIGKLVNILRSSNGTISSAIKFSIDTMNSSLENMDDLAES